MSLWVASYGIIPNEDLKTSEKCIERPSVTQS
jgi:hypothetical protein